jgi:hypothetical protein
VNRSYLDVHDDASVMRKETLVIQDVDHPMIASGCDATRAAKSLIMVSAALAYTIHESGRMT